MYVEKTFKFEASHQIANHPGKCRRLHGHSWEFTITCHGKLDRETKMVKDFYDIKQAVQPIIDRLDHQHLGCGVVKTFHGDSFLFSTVEGIPDDLLPTSENLLIWIASQLDLKLPWCRLRLNETCTSSAVLERWEFMRYHAKEGGSPHGEAEGHEERSEEGKEVPQEGEKVASEVYITDNDIPF